MACALSHALVCEPCCTPDRLETSCNDETHVCTSTRTKGTCIECDELKCCPSGEVTSSVCGCCYVCAKGTVYRLGLSPLWWEISGFCILSFCQNERI